ncbi:hypothetical protein I4F81_011564 [Pyropia yezoensis]|uniref:Uncharacterized protein n=1 Tax=Pyropia yezoensis TaxID=2788 RepID=A0ACC3CH48_PYRYE|nr:hypothetical protein I4F81_011564 [Neopyropia yezoensis]
MQSSERLPGESSTWIACAPFTNARGPVPELPLWRMCPSNGACPSVQALRGCVAEAHPSRSGHFSRLSGVLPIIPSYTFTPRPHLPFFPSDPPPPPPPLPHPHPASPPPPSRHALPTPGVPPAMPPPSPPRYPPSPPTHLSPRRRYPLGCPCRQAEHSFGWRCRATQLAGWLGEHRPRQRACLSRV